MRAAAAAFVLATLLLAHFISTTSAAVSSQVSAARPEQGGSTGTSSSQGQPPVTFSLVKAVVGPSGDRALLPSTLVSVDGAAFSFDGYTPAASSPATSISTSFPASVSTAWPNGGQESARFSGNAVTVSVALTAAYDSLRYVLTSDAFLQAGYLQGPLNVVGDTAAAQVSVALEGNTLTYTRQASTAALSYQATYLLFPDCDPTASCCHSSGAFKASNAVCRAATACAQQAVCSGDSATCPDSAPIAGECCNGAGRFAHGTVCRAATACARQAVCSGDRATCPPSVAIDAGVCCDGDGGFAEGTVCRAATACARQAVCSGDRATCPDSAPIAGECCDGAGGFSPNGAPCSWRPAHKFHPRPGAYTLDSTAGVASEPAFAGYDDGEDKWPGCRGKCMDNHCVLPWNHPRCCFVRPEDAHRGYSSSADGSFEDASVAGGFRSRALYCFEE